MKLLIVRHAIAMDRGDFQESAKSTEPTKQGAAGKADEANDDYRPLTLDGMRKMRKNAKGLRELVSRPDLLITSPLTRAVQTAAILNEIWRDLDVASSDLLRPGSSPEELTEWLNTRAFAHQADAVIAIVGHEPHLSSLASWYLTGYRKSMMELKKGGACLLDFATDVDKAKAKLEWLATPVMLRAQR